MNSNVLAQDVAETTNRLAQIICRKIKESTHGEIKGYLIPDEIRSVISKNERKNFSALDTQGVLVPCYGSVRCSETNWLTRSLTAMVIAYAVRNNLINNFEDYPFKKFEIELETYPKYRYDKYGFRKYKKTGDDISLLKTHIEW